MTKLELAKYITSTVVGLGTTKIVHATIKNNVTPENALDAVTVAAGSVAIAGVVTERSKVYTDTKIDEIATWWKTNVTKN